MSKINWSVRFKNKTWLASFLALIVTFVYQLLGMFDIAPAITQDNITQMISIVLTVLAGIGVIQDPTTSGVSDSKQALGYTTPKVDSDDDDDVQSEKGVG